MAIPDWVTQQVSEEPLPLPGNASWQQAPQTPEEAIAQAGFVPPVQTPVAEQAPTYAPSAAPVVAPVASMPEQAMSAAPEPQVSEPIASYQPPAPAQAQPLEQQIQIDPYEQNMQAMLSSYLRPKRIPQAVVKAAETWQQAVPSAMPGQENQYAAAKQALEESQNESLLDQRMQLMNQSDISDQDARNAYMQGRGYAAEAAAIADDQEQRRKVIDDRVGELDKLIEQRSQLQTSFNERNPVRDMSMWTRVAIGLGAAGQALAGGENAALSLAMREIDADMARERNQVDNLGLEIAAKRTLLGDMLQKFRDPAAADHAARAAKLGLYESGYRAQAAKEKSAELRAAMLSAADSLAMQREQEKLASLTGEHQTLMKWRPASVSGGGIAGLQKFSKDFALTPEQQRQLMLSAARGDNEQVMRVVNDAIGTGGMTGGNLSRDKDERERQLATRDLEVRMPANLGGGVGYAPKGSAVEFRKQIVAVSTLQGIKDRIDTLRRTHTNLSPTDRKEIEGAATWAVGILSNATGAGAPTGQEREKYGEVLTASINNLVTGDSVKLLENMQRLLDITKRPIQENLTRDAAGTQPFIAAPRKVK